MKRLLVMLTMFLLLGTTCYASSSYAYFETKKEHEATLEHVSQVGFKLLNDNRIDKRITFTLNDSKVVNAYSSIFDRSVTINKGLYSLLDDEDMLAAILGHEISHSIDGYSGILRGYFSFVTSICCPKKYEYKSDKRAVDFMVNAGYHPVAMIVIMNKAFPQYRYDWCAAHPLTSRRMMEVYEYIYKKYPEYLVNNKYKTNIYYQNFLLTSRENRMKLQKKVESGSKRKVHYL